MSLHAEVAHTLGRLDLELTLDVAAGETVAVLGPNGAGKTSLLRILAGLLVPDRASVRLGERVLDDTAAGVHVPTEERSVGVVFQDYLLFPHLSAVDNVAYGPRRTGVPKAQARDLATAALRQVGLDGFGAHRPGQLSGGQQQRVALARALVLHPQLVLLDEPLAALDAATRIELRRVLRASLEREDACRLVITHDPVDAVALADRIVVLEGGRVTQVGTLADVTMRPRSRYVADLVGTNLYTGTGTADGVALPGGAVVHTADAVHGTTNVLIAPRHVSLHTTAPEGSARNRWPGTVGAVEVMGDRVRVQVDGELPITAEITAAALADTAIRPGSSVWVSVKATACETYPV